MHTYNEKLCARLERLTHAPTLPGETIDVVVTMNEINDRHGTGPLVQRVLNGRRKILSIRARTDYGYQEFAEWSGVLSHKNKTVAQSRDALRRLLDGHRVERVLCVPYHADELLTALLLHETAQAPMCTWIMDDRNIAANLIPDDLICETLQKSSLRLATHPELCHAYERKFHLPFHILPAVAPRQLLCGEPGGVSPAVPLRAVLVGSIWDQGWFDRLCTTVQGSGLTIDWFGNNHISGTHFREQALTRAGIRAHGVVSEERLSEELRRASFAIVPVSPLDGSDSNPGIARLSLPGRILFIAACSNTPVLIAGSSETCGARFVKHFGIGEVIPYDRSSFISAIKRLAEPKTQAALRANAARLGPALSDEGVSSWLRHSTFRGEPMDARFENLFAGYAAVSEASVLAAHEKRLAG